MKKFGIGNMKHGNSFEHACMVCGKAESCITVYRHWLGADVRSDECESCHAYMNEKLIRAVMLYAPVRRKGNKVVSIERGRISDRLM